MFGKLLELLDVFNNVAQKRNEAYLDNFTKRLRVQLNQEMDVFAKQINFSLKDATVTFKEDK